MTPTIDIETAVLSTGAHSGPNEGMCVMELSSYIAREPWSDHPACVSLVLASFLRSWNDALDDETRQKLKPYSARVIGTANDGKDDQRAWLCTDWLARTHLPVWLDLAGLSEHAAAVRAIIAISDPTSASAAQPIIAAARDAAWAAAWAAPRAAGATGFEAWAAVWSVAGVLVRYAAGGVAGECNATWAEAGMRWVLPVWRVDDAIRPSVVVLQASAFDLLDRMLSL